jgi:DNA-binding SARP family transcriptional activator
MSEAFNLVFFPTVQASASKEQVIDQLATTLKVERTKIAGWYATDKPTILLKNVPIDVAERYRSAIMDSGGACNIQPGDGDKANLSLVPKPLSTNLFYCPACEHEEDLPLGEVMLQCPKCDLVLSKWQERLKEEKEKDDIRRRLLRDAQLNEDSSQLHRKRRDELDRLRQLEREIMLELGIKPPGRFWLFYSDHPFSVSAAVALLLLTCSSIGLFLVNDWVHDREQAALAEAPSSEAVLAMTPVVTAAVQLSQAGKGEMLTEITEVAQQIRGGSSGRAEIIRATEQLMKGVNIAPFLKLANNASQQPQAMTLGGEGSVPLAINTRSLGGINGLVGVSVLDVEERLMLLPPLLVHGPDQLFEVLGDQHQIARPTSAVGATARVPAIEKMDGSRIVELMKSLATDIEWDEFLASQVPQLQRDRRLGDATELLANIKNPVVKIRALIAMLERDVAGTPEMDRALAVMRIKIDIARISDADTQAMLLLQVGKRLAAMGVGDQPRQSIDWVEALLEELNEPYAISLVAGRLAVSSVQHGDQEVGSRWFSRARSNAASITDISQRIAAFARLARHYAIARNRTLANEILAEAQLLAATRLRGRQRALAFAEISLALGHMGDMQGALLAIDNATYGHARQQLLATIAESLLDENAFRQAQAVMDQIDDAATKSRLGIRLITNVAYQGRLPQAKLLLAEYGVQVRQIFDLGKRGMMLSQFARLATRLGQPDMASRLFAEMEALSANLLGREAMINKGMLAINQARSLLIKDAMTTLESIDAVFIRDPVMSEIVMIERTVKNLMPVSVSASLL